MTFIMQNTIILKKCNWYINRNEEFNTKIKNNWNIERLIKNYIKYISIQVNLYLFSVVILIVYKIFKVERNSSVIYNFFWSSKLIIVNSLGLAD